jgi:hypothetical protein
MNNRLVFLLLHASFIQIAAHVANKSLSLQQFHIAFKTLYHQINIISSGIAILHCFEPAKYIHIKWVKLFLVFDKLVTVHEEVVTFG